MDYLRVNERAWDEETEKGNHWTIPASHEAIMDAKAGKPHIFLTPDREIPSSWLEGLGGKALCIASGGGQEGPIYASMGLDVTVLDISEKQLERDKETAKREGLRIRTIKGSMEDLSIFKDGEFDHVMNPVSVNFIPDAKSFYRDLGRIVRKGGTLITAFANPALYMFDEKKLMKGKMEIKYTLPFSASSSLSKKERKRIEKGNGTLEYSHTMEYIFTGLAEGGFHVTGLISDGSSFEPIDSFLKECYFIVHAVKA